MRVKADSKDWGGWGGGTWEWGAGRGVGGHRGGDRWGVLGLAWRRQWGWSPGGAGSRAGACRGGDDGSGWACWGLAGTVSGVCLRRVLRRPSRTGSRSRRWGRARPPPPPVRLPHARPTPSPAPRPARVSPHALPWPVTRQGASVTYRGHLWHPAGLMDTFSPYLSRAERGSPDRWPGRVQWPHIHLHLPGRPPRHVRRILRRSQPLRHLLCPT